MFNINDKMISDRTKPDPPSLWLYAFNKRKLFRQKCGEITRFKTSCGIRTRRYSQFLWSNRFSRQLKNNEKINIFGKGLDVRSHLYIQDLEKIIYLVNNKKIFGTLNISPLKSYSFIDVAKKIINNFDKNLKYKDHINFIKNNKLSTKRQFKNLKINKFFKSKDMTDINKVCIN